jgi:hypothetical protein
MIILFVDEKKAIKPILGESAEEIISLAAFTEMRSENN